MDRIMEMSSGVNHPTPSPGQRERSAGREQRAGALTVHLHDANIYGALIRGLGLGDTDEALSLNCL